jgi:hypothetical protein
MHGHVNVNRTPPFTLFVCISDCLSVSPHLRSSLLSTFELGKDWNEEVYLAMNDLIYLKLCNLKFTYASSKISAPVTHLVSITKNSQFTLWTERTDV